MSRLEDYQEYFRHHIFERGEVIAQTNAIEIIKNTEDFIQARVQGTELYDVSIKILVDEIYMECTCPYAESGKLCKHMAAVLIRARSLYDYSDETEEEFDWMKKPYLKKDQDFYKDKIVEHMKEVDPSRLVEFMAEKLMDNDNLKRAYIASFVNSGVNVEAMIREFNRICHKYLGRDNFINYYQASYFFNELDLYLRDLYTILDQGGIKEAAKIISNITIGFDGMDLDDSDGHTQIFYGDIIDIVQRILEADSLEANETIYKWMDVINKDPNSWFLQDCIYPIWTEQFPNKDFINKEIESLESIIRQFNKNEYGRSIDYVFIGSLEKLIDLKTIRGDSQTEIINIIKPYDDTTYVNKYLINIAQNNNDVIEEERLLKNAIKIGENQNLYGYLKDAEYSLSQLYKRENRVIEYMHQLKQLVIKKTDYNLDYYREYKSLFDKTNWERLNLDIIKEIHKNLRDNNIMPEIYIEERMLEELFVWLKNHGDLGNLKKYSKHVLKDHDEEMLILYLEELDKIAEYAGSHSHYRNIVEWMKYIKDNIPGGENAIVLKESQYRVKYKRRKNFLKELDKKM